MKVLHLSAFLEYAFGGAEQVTRQLIPLLGVDSVAACLDGGSHNLGGVPTVSVPTLTKEGSAWSEWYKRWVMLCQGKGEARKTAEWLSRQTAVQGCDLLHCHDFHWIRVAGLLAKLLHKPLVVTCHQNLPFRIGLSGGMGTLINSALEHRDAERREFLRGAAAIVAPSQFCLDSVSKFLGLGAPTLLVIPNWLDDEVLASPRHEKPSMEMVYVGRFSEEKGTDLLLRAIDDLPGHQLTAIGCGPLEKEVSSHQSVRRFPWMDHPLALSIMGCHQIGVIPSQIDESFGLTALEYRHLGLKIVSTISGGIYEVLENYPNVFWTHRGKPLAPTIRKAMAIPAVPDPHLGSFRERFHRTTVVKAYRTLYEKVTNQEPDPFDPIKASLVYPYGFA